MHKRLFLVLSFIVAALTLQACEAPVVLVPPTPAVTLLPVTVSPGAPVDQATQPSPTSQAVEVTETPSATATTEPAPVVSAQPAPTREQTAPQVVLRPEGFPPYFLQQGTPLAAQNFTHPEAGCNWMGVGGQVFDKDGKPVEGMIIELGGSLAGQPVSILALSGGAKALGPSGFEIALSSQPLETNRTMWVQLFDLTGKAQSARVGFNTYKDCARNMIIINFNELTALPIYHLNLPLVQR